MTRALIERSVSAVAVDIFVARYLFGVVGSWTLAKYSGQSWTLHELEISLMKAS